MAFVKHSASFAFPQKPLHNQSRRQRGLPEFLRSSWNVLYHQRSCFGHDSPRILLFQTDYISLLSNKGLHWGDGASGGAGTLRGRRCRAVGHVPLQLIHPLLQLGTLRQQFFIALMNRFLITGLKKANAESGYSVNNSQKVW